MFNVEAESTTNFGLSMQGGGKRRTMSDKPEAQTHTGPFATGFLFEIEVQTWPQGFFHKTT